MSTPKVLLVVISIFLATAAVVYWQLGGWEEPTLETVEVADGEYRLLGKPYVGTPGHPDLEKIFRDVRQRWERGELSGTVAIAVLKEPATNTDTLEQFVGVLLPPNTQPEALPEGYEIMRIPAQKSVRARLKANSVVWPSPLELREKIAAYAKQQNYRLRSGISLEKYVSPSQLEVEIPMAAASE